MPKSERPHSTHTVAICRYIVEEKNLHLFFSKLETFPSISVFIASSVAEPALFVIILPTFGHFFPVFRIRIQGCYGSGSGFQVFKNDYYDYDEYDYDDYDYDDYDYDDCNYDYDYDYDYD